MGYFMDRFEEVQQAKAELEKKVSEGLSVSEAFKAVSKQRTIFTSSKENKNVNE